MDGTEGDDDDYINATKHTCHRLEDDRDANSTASLNPGSVAYCVLCIVTHGNSREFTRKHLALPFHLKLPTVNPEIFGSRRNLLYIMIIMLGRQIGEAPGSTNVRPKMMMLQGVSENNHRLALPP